MVEGGRESGKERVSGWSQERRGEEREKGVLRRIPRSPSFLVAQRETVLAVVPERAERLLRETKHAAPSPQHRLPFPQHCGGFLEDFGTASVILLPRSSRRSPPRTRRNSS